MPFVGLTGPHTAPGAQRESRGVEPSAARSGRLALTALMLLPGALVVFMGFNAGGYFPATPAIVAASLG